MSHLFLKIKKDIEGKVVLPLLFVLFFIGILSATLLTLISDNPRQQASAAVTVYDCTYYNTCFSLPGGPSPAPVTSNPFASSIKLNDPNCEINTISLKQTEEYIATKVENSKYKSISQNLFEIYKILPMKFKQLIAEKVVNKAIAQSIGFCATKPAIIGYFTNIGAYGYTNVATGSWPEYTTAVIGCSKYDDSGGCLILKTAKNYTSMNLYDFNKIYNVEEENCSTDFLGRETCATETTNPPDLTQCPTGATNPSQCQAAEYVGIQYYCDGGGASSECFDNPRFVTQSMINTSYNICLGSTTGTCAISMFNGVAKATQVTTDTGGTGTGGGGTTGTVFGAVTVSEPALPPPGATPTPTPVLPYDPPTSIHGFYYVDEGATIDPVSGICEYEPIYHDNKREVEVENIVLTPAGESAVVLGDNYYEVITKYQSTYQVNLNLSSTPNADGDIYACSCPSPESIPGNTDVSQCAYYEVGANNQFADFFIKQYNLLNGGWWQVAGGNAYALNDMTSKVPYEGCASESTCYAGIMASNPLDTVEKDTTGLAMVGLGQIYSHRSDTTGEGNYTMVPNTRTGDSGDNARALGITIPQQNYAYFVTKIGNKTQIAGSNQPPSSGTYIYNGDVTINNLNPWVIGDNESMIVFINGDLNFDDTGDGNKLTQVSSSGGFLAFIVSGSVNISSDVGFEDPATVATAANSNIEGVFITDGSINIQTRGTDVPDKKFIGAGTFVGYTGINTDRDFSDGDLGAIDNNIYAAETFIYRPDLLLNTPLDMKTANYHWQEIAPSSN